MSDSPPKADAGPPVKPETLTSGALDDAAKAMDAAVVKSDVLAPAPTAADAIVKDSAAPKPTGFIDNPQPAVDLMQLPATTSGMHQQYVAPGVQRASFLSSTKWQIVMFVGAIALVAMFFLQKGMGGDLASTGGEVTTTTTTPGGDISQQGFPDPNNVRPPPPITPQADFTVNAATIGGAVPPTVRKGDGGTTNKGGYAEEAADLEAARLMVAKDPDKALAMCDQHDIDYPRGMLDPEARVIRVEAYAKKGDDAKALSLGNDFLEDYPHSPRAGRVVAIVEALKNKQDAGH